MDPTARLLEDYLDRRTRHPGVGADADPLFHGPHQTRLTRWGVTKILARHVQAVRRREPGYAAGVNVTPHVIRRTRAMHLLKAGVNVIYIRDLLGHADVSTTEIYARADPEAKRKAVVVTPTSHSPLSPCPAGQSTEISSNGSTRSADNRPDYVAGTGARDRPSKGNTPAGHITHPST